MKAQKVVLCFLTSSMSWWGSTKSAHPAGRLKGFYNARAIVKIAQSRASPRLGVSRVVTYNFENLLEAVVEGEKCGQHLLEDDRAVLHSGHHTNVRYQVRDAISSASVCRQIISIK